MIIIDGAQLLRLSVIPNCQSFQMNMNINFHQSIMNIASLLSSFVKLADLAGLLYICNDFLLFE